MDKPKLQPRLVVIEGKDKGKAISLRNGTSIIGRSKADVIIEDPRISRSHVALHFDEKNSTVSFTDLKSLNGTLLNSLPAESGELKDGDKLQLGNTLFDCQLRVDAWEASISVSIRPPEPSAPPGVGKAGKGKANYIGGHESSISKIEPEVEPHAKSAVKKDRATKLGDGKNAGPEEREEHTGVGEIPVEPAKLQKIRDMYSKLPHRARLWVWVGLLCGFLFWGMSGSNPAGDVATWAKVESMEKLGKSDEAFAMVERLVKANPDDANLQWKAGEYFEKQGRFDSAIGAYTNAANAPQPEPLATIKLISLLLRSGKDDKSEPVQSAMAKLDTFLRDGPHTKELFIEAAQLYIENKQFKNSPEKALILAKALQKEFAPTMSIGYKLEAQVLFHMKRNEEALAIVEQGLKLAPQDEWLLENQAFAKLSLRDLSGAESVVRKWLDSSPQNTKAQLVMAYLRFNEKDFAGALPYTQSILQQKQNEPDNAYYKEALYLTGEIYWSQGQPGEATAFMKRACEVGYEQGCKHPALTSNAEAPADRSTAAPAERESPPQPAPQTDAAQPISP